MNNTPNIEIFVLAGGRSRRMGRDKAFVELKGRPMIFYVLKVLQELALPIKIIANKPDYETLGYEVIKDEILEKGPMGGLFTALQHSQADFVLLVGCDMPLISMEALCLLTSSARGGYISAAAKGDRVNPLFALYPREIKDAARAALAAEQLKMADLISKNKHILVPSIGERMPWALQNINDKNDLKEVEERWKHLL